MKYIYNNEELSAREIKALNPNTSYHEPTQVGAIPVLPTPKPSCGELETVVRNGTTIDALGNTVQAWIIVDKFKDYIDDDGIAHTKAEQEAEHLVNVLKDAKAKKVEELKAKIAYISVKPRVDTGLGYFVDGGRVNKDDFFSAWESMLEVETTTIRDADNQFHANTSKSDMQTIYRSIVANGKLILGYKWQKETEIEACTTVDQVLAVEI